MTEAKDKARKTDYDKAVAAYEQALKTFKKKDYAKAQELFAEVVEKYGKEKELVDRSRLYVAMCSEKQQSQAVSLKTFEDYYQYGVYKLNQGEAKESAKLLAKAQQMEPKTGKIPYLQAIAALKQENVSEAMNFLKQAVQLDEFFRILAQNEVEFEKIADNEQYKSLIG